MVRQLQGAAGEVWIELRPNRALNWGQLRFMAVLLALPGLIVALGFLVTGVWLVLPFWGLEILACWWALWWVGLQCNRRELIRFAPDWVIIERGRRQLDERHRFQRAWARFEVVRGHHPWYGDRIFLCQHGRRLELGAFLGADEKSRLLELLRAEVARGNTTG